jgi:hypothetical protein
MQANRGFRACVAISIFAAFGSIPAGAQAAETASQSFTFTGSEQQFVVPAGVNSVQVTLIGGSGAAGAREFSEELTPGGMGSMVVGTLSVTPGETLFTEVAGNGGRFGEPGYNGGGAGAGHAGGGGGSSNIQTCSTSNTNVANPPACATIGSLGSRLLVAGGGGGGGSLGGDEAAFGGGGGSAGEHGENGIADEMASGGSGGGAGLQSSGGPAGSPSSGSPAGAGAVGVGGIGGSGTGFAGGGGGGGGGGLYGGGGGGGGQYAIFQSSIPTNGGGGGGGGGSSGVPTGATGATLLSSSATSASPSVGFTWILPPPAAVTGSPQAVTATSATLTGTVNPDGSSVGDCHFTISPAPPSGASTPCTQQVGAGGMPVAISASATGLVPGTVYSVTLVATSAQGTSAGTPITFATAEGIACAVSAPSTQSTPVCPSEFAKVPPPVINALKLSPTRFRRGTHAATIANKPKKKTKALPTSTTISFALSSAATAKLSFEQAQPGVLAGRKCVAISKTHRAGKRCTHYKPVRGGVTRSGHPGTDKLTFAGVLDGGSRLAPGTYRLTLVATNPGGTTTAAQHPSFTLLG